MDWDSLTPLLIVFVAADILGWVALLVIRRMKQYYI